jgi:DNA-binding NarL/FixJ family response regulator
VSDRPTRIVLVDDQKLVRSGMKALLEAEPDLHVTGEASDGAEGVELALTRRPDVVLMDVEQVVLRALRAGANGFVLKDAAPAHLVEAVRIVATGDTLLAPPVARRLVDALLSHTHPGLKRRFEHLTERERDIVRHLAMGRSNAAVAQELSLSEGTVKTHVTRLLTKLGVRSRVQVVVLAYESGFVRPGHTDGIDL